MHSLNGNFFFLYVIWIVCLQTFMPTLLNSLFLGYIFTCLLWQRVVDLCSVAILAYCEHYIQYILVQPVPGRLSGEC